VKHYVKENIMADVGRLHVQVFQRNSYIPVSNARVTVIPREDNARQPIELQSNSSGITQVIDLVAPPIEYSLDPNNTTMQPYSTCDVLVEAEGFEPLQVRGCQILPEITALQVCNLIPAGATGAPNGAGVNGNGGTGSTNTISNGARRWFDREILQPSEIIEVPANTLFGNFPPKIPEDPVKPLPPPTGGVVLQQVVVPEFVVVHAGVPTNTAAPNYKVKFQDYIKNVASCEIYATWDEKAIRANIYCILSFTLNRIFTEWYRGKGYSFDITNSTAYDHAFTYGRNIYDNISRVVDELFTSYIKRRTGGKQPLLTQYCDGRQVQCPGWLTQWGSQGLAEQGRTPYQILTNFYGSDIDILQAQRVSGIPQSYPGYTLKIGSSGTPVRTKQTFLNRIGDNYPAIPKVAVSGNYDQATANAVKTFQSIFNLPQTGEIDYATWYSISNIYVGVSKIAELRSTISPSAQSSRFYPPVPYEGMVNVPNIKYPI
jgi:peptidoglycan hydrolase-like protein with peptidoglycan-binding domain